MKVRRAYAEVSHGQVHFATCGQPDAPAVLLLHQTPRSCLEYGRVLPLLGGSCRAIAMDTPGFGASDTLPGAVSIEAWAEVAVQLLDALDIASAHVVGHHTGGVIAFEMAVCHSARVRSVVLSSTPYTDADFRRERASRPPIDAVEVDPDGAHLAALWRRRQAFYPAGRSDLLQAFVADALRVCGDVEAGHRAVAGYAMEGKVAALLHPTLLMQASDDPFAAPHLAHWRAALPRAQVVAVPGGMVPLPDQMPDAFAGAVLDFVQGQHG